jgi:hypothetical protein
MPNSSRLASALIARLSVGDGPEAWGWAAATGVLWGEAVSGTVSFSLGAQGTVPSTFSPFFSPFLRRPPLADAQFVGYYEPDEQDD